MTIEKRGLSASLMPRLIKMFAMRELFNVMCNTQVLVIKVGFAFCRADSGF